MGNTYSILRKVISTGLNQVLVSLVSLVSLQESVMSGWTFVKSVGVFALKSEV